MQCVDQTSSPVVPERIRTVGTPNDDRWERFDRLQRNLRPFLRGYPKYPRVQRFRTYADLAEGRFEEPA